MAEIKKMVLTDLGRHDLMLAMQNDTNVNWNTLVVGDGGGTTPQLNEKATSLVNEVWSGQMSNKIISSADDNVISLHGIIPSTAGDFWIREAGLKNERGELVLLAETNETEKLSTETSGIVSEIDMYFDLTVANSELIEVSINGTSIYCTIADLENLEKKLEKKLSDNNTEITQEVQEQVTEVTDKINQIEELENDDVDRIFSYEGGPVGPGGYPEDWEEATTDDIDSLFN